MSDHARELRFYLPSSFGDRAQIRGTFTAYEWRDMTPPVAPSAEWTYAAPDIERGDVYSFRYRVTSDGTWIEATDPLARRYSQRFHQETKRYDLEAIVTAAPTALPAPPPRPTSGMRVCECTLPGLAARWLPPGALAQSASTTGPSLAARLVGSGLGEELRRRGYSAVMLPLQASAADTEYYNWKFGYLVTGLGAIHQSFGDWDELRALIAEFH